jgi:hypothetical protein
MLDNAPCIYHTFKVEEKDAPRVVEQAMIFFTDS